MTISFFLKRAHDIAQQKNLCASLHNRAAEAELSSCLYLPNARARGLLNTSKSRAMVLIPFLLLAVLMLGDAWPLAQPGSAFGDKQGNHRHLSDAAATATASDASLYDVVIMVGPSEATIACTVLRAIRKHAQGARRIIALSPSDPLTTSLKAEGRDASGKGLWTRRTRRRSC